MERRLAELRADGDRRLSGVLMRYGDVATLPWGRERFLPGAFGPVEDLDVVLNVQHDRKQPIARTGGGGLLLRDDGRALTMEADLPDTRAASDVLELVRLRVLRGLSVEFRAKRGGSQFEYGIRTVSAAALPGVGIVDRAAYPDATVEAVRWAGVGDDSESVRRFVWL